MKHHRDRAQGRARRHPPKRTQTPAVWLTWPCGQGVPGWRAECILRRVGIPVLKRRGVSQPDDHFGLLVPGDQAVWAEYNLVRAGVALSSPLLNPAHAHMQPAPLPPAWGRPARPHGLWGWFFAIMGALFAGDLSKGRPVGSTKSRAVTGRRQRRPQTHQVTIQSPSPGESQ